MWRSICYIDLLSCSYVPDVIKGDLDSLRPSVHDYFSRLGVPIIKDDDQYATDLGKCIEEIEKNEDGNGVSVHICHPYFFTRMFHLYTLQSILSSFLEVSPAVSTKRAILCTLCTYFLQEGKHGVNDSECVKERG